MRTIQVCARVAIVVVVGLALRAQTALAVACTPASPCPISACPTTISTPGNYAVTKDLTATGSCIHITVSNVAIAFKGHTLTGNGTGNGVDDGGNAIQFTALSNGKIKAFNTGISFPTNLSTNEDTQAAAVTLNNITVSHNTGDGIFILGGSNAFRKVTANHNGGNGFNIGSGGVGDQGCCNTFTGVVARANGSEGVFSNRCCSFMTDAAVTDNGSVGVEFDGCCSIVSSSTITNNALRGVLMNDCCNEVDTSIASNNGTAAPAAGIALSGGFNATVKCQANSNTGNGVVLTGGFNMVTGVNANSNGLNGIDVSDDFLDTITNSVASSNTGHGLAIDCPSNIVRLTAQSNAGGNLITSGGTCTELGITD